MALLSDYINNQKPKTQQAETAAAPSKGLLSSFVEKSGVQPAKKTAAPMLTALEQRQPRSSVPLVQAPGSTKTLTPLERIQQGVGQKTEFKPITPPGGIPKIPVPTLGERLGLMTTGGLKGSAANYVASGAAATTGKDRGMNPIYSKDLEAIQQEIDAYTAMLESGKEYNTKTKQYDGTPLSAEAIKRAEEQLAHLTERKGTYAKSLGANEGLSDNLWKEAAAIRQSANSDLMNAKKDADPIGSTLIDAGSAVVQMVPDIALSKLTGGVVSPLTFQSAGVFGAGAQAAKEAGKSDGQILAKGALSALTTYGVSKLSNISGVSKMFSGGSGKLDDAVENIIKKTVDKLATTAVGKTVLYQTGKLAASGVGEGLEEMLEDAFSPLVDAISYGDAGELSQYASADYYSDMLYDGLVGGVVGIAAGGLDSAIGSRKVFADYKNTPKQNTQAPTSPLNAPVSADTTSMGVDTTKTQDVAQRATEGAETANVANAAEKPYGIFPENSVGAKITTDAAQQAKPEATKPTVFYTGSSNPNITEFKAGGDGNTKQSGDSFGVGVYLTDNPDVAKLYAQGDSGKVYTVSTDSDLLSLEDKATPKFVKTVAESISDAPKQYRNRILRDVGRVKESFSDVNAAQDFYHKADEEWKKEDGQYSGNRPTVSKQGNVFTIEYTDYGSDLQNLLMQSTNRQLFEAIAAINTNDASGLVMASGYDGITYHDGGAFNSGIEGNTAVVYRNTHRIKQVDEAIKPETQSPSIFPENSLGAKLTSGMPQGTGAAEQGFVPTTEYDTWSQNTENGKFHDVGENPVRSVDLPKVNPQGENTMKTAATVMESQNTPEARVREIQQALVDGDMGYIPIANEKLAAQADAKVKRNGWQTSLTDWTAQVRSGKVSPQLMAEGAILLNNAANAPECTKEAYITLLTDYANLNHASGQALQAARILKKLSPEGKLYAMQRSVQSMVEEYSSKNKTVDIKLDAELADKYRKATTDTERDAIVSEIQQDIADQLLSTGLDKWTALRYVNMLGNFKTQIRNVAGNTTMLLVTKTKNEVAAALELIANKASGGKFERTKSFTNGKGLYRAAYADFENVQSAAMGEGKYSQSNAKSEFEKGIEEKKTIFKANGDWGKKADSNIAAKGARAATDVGFKVLEAYRNITNRAMEQGDVIFSRVTYADALAGYLKVHAVSAQQLTNGQVDTALLDRARLFAIKEAQEATFRDTNAFSSAVSNFDRGWSKGGQVLSKGIMPFRKTPANIAVRAEEYSPLGAINTAVKAVQLAKGAENVSGADVINSLSKTLTGSGIMMLGWALAKSGLLRGKEDDENQKAFDQLTGQQDYSVTIGGVSFTLDWLTPASMPLFVGAALYDLTAENGIKPNDIESALTSIADPIISMSMMSGVNDALSNIKYSDNNLMQFVLSSAMNYLTQGVTNTLLGQVERTVEENRMATYIDEKSGFPQWLQRGIGKASAKTPGLEYNQGEYVDAWGRTQNNGSVAGKIGINFLSPAYISKPKETALVNELERLYDATGNSSVVPKRMTDREFDTYNGTYTMTVQEQVSFQKTRGQYAFKELSALTESADYKAMSDEDKAKAVAAVQEQATLAAKQSIVEAKGGMFIPSATANDKISEYTAAGISKKQAYDLYKTVSQISTTDSAEKKYETIKAIGQQGYTDKQAIAVAATLYTTHDEDTGEVNKQSMLPYLATSKHLLSLYLNTKDSEMVSMAVPVSFSDKKVEYVLTATEKELFQFAYAKEFNAWANNLSTAEDVKKYRDKAYGFAKSVIIQYRQSGG